jgi:hypothetical protein
MAAKINPGLIGEISPIRGENHLLANSRVPERISKDFDMLMVIPKDSIRDR